MSVEARDKFIIAVAVGILVSCLLLAALVRVV